MASWTRRIAAWAAAAMLSAAPAAAQVAGALELVLLADATWSGPTRPPSRWWRTGR